jgi:hypothetical protein
MEGSLLVNFLSVFSSNFAQAGRGIVSSFISKTTGSFQAPTLYTIKGILILDNDGRRIYANYYDIFPTLKEQTAFEKSLFTKTSKVSIVCLFLSNFTTSLGPVPLF